MKHRRAIPLVFALALVGAACSPGTGTTTTAPGSAPAGSAPAGSAPAASPDEPSVQPSMDAGEDPEQLVLGLVPSREADVLVENAQPLVDYLAEELDIPVEGFVPTNYPGLVAAMRTGQAHIGAFGPFGLVQAADQAGAEIILQSGRDGSVTYHTQWMTNDPGTYCMDEPVENEEGLLFCNGTLDAAEGPAGEDAIAMIEDGTTVSFVGETSASGYIFPAVQLVNAGIDHVEGIEPLFAGGHDTSVIAVCNGDAEVGVSFNDARTILQEGDCDDLSQVVVFAYSPEIPNDGVAVAGNLSDELKENIKQAFLSFAETEEGKATLDAVYEIDEFAEADLDAFDVVREAAEKVGGSD